MTVDAEEPTARGPSRRRLLRRMATASIVGPLVALAGHAAAEPGNSKADVKYQYTPKGSDQCSVCVSFVPSTTTGVPATSGF